MKLNAGFKRAHAREKILAYFNEKLLVKVDECCDNCGANATFLTGGKTRKQTNLQPWEEVLSKLCHIRVRENK